MFHLEWQNMTSECLHGLENRQILKNMLCVRYQSDKKRITVNEDALPVGYTYDKIMHKEDYDSLTPLERQAALLEYADFR